MTYTIVCQNVFMQVIGVVGPFSTESEADQMCDRINESTEYVAKVLELTSPSVAIEYLKQQEGKDD